MKLRSDVLVRVCFRGQRLHVRPLLERLEGRSFVFMCSSTPGFRITIPVEDGNQILTRTLALPGLGGPRLCGSVGCCELRLGVSGYPPFGTKDDMICRILNRDLLRLHGRAVIDKG